MKRDELKFILEQHKAWVDTDATEGERADLRQAELRGVNDVGLIEKEVK